MKNREELIKILDRIDEREIRDDLLDILVYYRDVYDWFRRKHLELFSSLSKDDYKVRIDNIYLRCGDKKGYVDEEASFELSRLMFEVLKEVEEIVKLGDFDLALDIVDIVFKSIVNYEPDDSYGNINDFARKGVDIIGNIIDECFFNRNEKCLNRIFEYILNEIVSCEYSNYCIEINLLLDKFISKDMYLDKIEKTLVKFLEISDKSWVRRDYINLLNSVCDKTGSKYKFE